MQKALAARAAPSVSRAFVALGSNLGNANGGSLAQLQSAVRAIHAFDGCDVTQCSPVYQSPAQEATSVQPDYLNAVLLLETRLQPITLLNVLLTIEHSHGRVRDARGERNSARTLDLDLLMFNDEIFSSETLTVPHPRMHLRAFVLRPLLDVAGDVTIPGHGAASNFLPAVSAQPIKRFAEPLQWI
jgi:2-amino-4-hydroxy-6-hydroxymethyldihydropteridine diphosphokinase